MLDDAQRAELFQGLGRTLGAGLSATQALGAMGGICDGALDRPLRLAAAAVGKGAALTASLDRQGLITDRDYALLAAGEDSGHLDRVCLSLAERYHRSAVRWRQLKGRLLLPAAVLVISILVAPLPALARGSLSASGYVTRTVAALALLAVLAKLASLVVRHWREAGTPGWLTRLARLVPGTARLSRLHHRADVCERLALSLGAGLPAHDALHSLARAERNSVRGAALVRARSELGGGRGVADALGEARILDPSSFAIVSAGEGAGRLEDCLRRVAEAAHDTLDDDYALLARWIPIVVYALVAGHIAAGLIGNL